MAKIVTTSTSLVRRFDRRPFAAFAFACCAAAGMLVAGAASAASPRFSDFVFADNKDGDTPQEVFNPETPEIFLRANLVNVPKDAKLSATWIAEDTDKAQPNYKIDTSTTAAGLSTTVATFSLSKPSAGWPLGDYRVDLAIDDKPTQQVRFKIANPPVQ